MYCKNEGVEGREHDDKRQVLAINSTCVEHHRHALSFKPFKALTEKETETVEKLASGITIKSMKAQGALKYAWVGEKEVRGLGSHGGFAYIFKDPKMNRVFPLLGAREIIDRADMDSAISSRMLPPEPKSFDVQSWLNSRARAQSCTEALRKTRMLRSQEITIARLRARGLLHPLVLRAIWTTPRRRALSTIASRAIVHQSYKITCRYVYADLLLQLVSLVAISVLAASIRSGDFERDGLESADLRVAIGVATCACMHDVARGISTFVGYLRRGWSKSYLSKGSRFFVHLVVHLSLMVRLYAGRNGSGDAGARPLAALAGGFVWLRFGIARAPGSEFGVFKFRAADGLVNCIVRGRFPLDDI